MAVSAVTLLSTVLAVGQAAGSTEGASGASSGGSQRWGTLKTVVGGLDGPRGVDVSKDGRTVVYSVSDGTVYKASYYGGKRHIRSLGKVPGGFAPAVDMNDWGVVYAVTGAGGEPGGPVVPGTNTLYRMRPGHSPLKVADIGAYQKKDPDPYDLEDNPTDSNAFGVVALRDGTVLVSDAAGNDLLRVWPRSGKIKTIARIKPRTVAVPAGLPAKDPEGNPLPPAGTRVPSEAVATSVTVGSDGYYYVGELRGFPATPGKSQIWRIKPGTYGAVCDPTKPRTGKCQRYADGYTSIVDLSGGPRGTLAVVELAKKSWLQFELSGQPAVGALILQFRGRHHQAGYRHELVPGKLILPGGVAVSRRGTIYVTAPIFGPGAVYRVQFPHHH